VEVEVKELEDELEDELEVTLKQHWRRILILTNEIPQKLRVASIKFYFFPCACPLYCCAALSFFLLSWLCM